MDTSTPKPIPYDDPVAPDKPAKHPGGRPTLYRPEYARQAFQFCLLGATDARLAELFEVSEVTIGAWKKGNPEFLGAIRAGREQADAKVATSLYKRALGYDYEDSHVSAFQGDVTVTPIKKHVPADVAAASLWLRNRQPDRWRDKQQVEHSGALDLMALLDAASERRMIDVTPDGEPEATPETAPESDEPSEDPEGTP